MRKITGAMLRDYQLPIVRSLINGEKSFAFLIFPRKSGKSLLAFYTANALICKRKERIVHILIVAKEKSQTNDIYGKNLLEDGRTLFSILPDGAVYSKYDSEIRYSNGSTIKFNGSDNIQTIVGGRYDMIIADEFATWKTGSYELLYPCLRNPGKDSVLLIITTVRGKNHAWKLFKEVEHDPEWLATKTNVIELGLMTQSEYNNLKGDPNYKAQEYLNDVDSAFINAVYSRPNVVNEKFTPGAPLYIGVDIAEMNDANAFVGCQIIDNEIHIIFTLKFILMQTNSIITELKAKVNKITTMEKTVLYMPHDANRRSGLTGLTRLQHYQQEGFNCFTVPLKGVIDGIQLVRSQWHILKFYAGKDACDEGIEDIKSYTADENGAPITNTSNHKFSHVPDALRYLCIGLERYDIIKGWREPIQYQMSHYKGMKNYKVI